MQWKGESDMRELAWVAGMAVGVAAMFVTAGRAEGAAADAFFPFVAGQAVFLGCGSGLFLRLYGRLLSVVRRPFLKDPLEAIAQHRYLLIGLHVLVFGGFIACGVAAHYQPELQARLSGTVVQIASRSDNPLGIAAVAYKTRSVLVAAAVTLAGNFLYGTVLVVTLPSLIVPGIGVLIVLMRACGVGLILAPTSARLMHVMAWHSATVLVEMEAYILAAFFALLVLVYLVRPRYGEAGSERYLKASVLNLKGALLVLVLLAAAALYEAPEVIGQMP